MSEPVLLVAGLGRCGTTLVMHMLRAAGVPVAGDAPAFENIPLARDRCDLEWLARQRGRAVKWIDPVNARIPNPADWRYRVIFLRRHPMQQALSMLKFTGAPSDRQTRRALAQSVARDTSRALRICDRLAGSYGTLHLRFESLIQQPLAEAARMAVFCDSHGFGFGDPEAAAAEVVKRAPDCADDLRIEDWLLARAKAASLRETGVPCK